jgi:hypothetical protein
MGIHFARSMHDRRQVARTRAFEANTLARARRGETVPTLHEPRRSGLTKYCAARGLILQHIKAYSRDLHSMSWPAPREPQLTIAAKLLRCSICKYMPSPTGRAKLFALLVTRTSCGIALEIVSRYEKDVAVGRAFPRRLPAATIESTGQGLQPQRYRTTASTAGFGRYQ